MKAIDGQKVELKAKRTEGRGICRVIIGGSVVWAQDFEPGTTVREMRAEAKRALEAMGVIQDGEA